MQVVNCLFWLSFPPVLVENVDLLDLPTSLIDPLSMPRIRRSVTIFNAMALLAECQAFDRPLDREGVSLAISQMGGLKRE